MVVLLGDRGCNVGVNARVRACFLEPMEAGLPNATNALALRSYRKGGRGENRCYLCQFEAPACHTGATWTVCICSYRFHRLDCGGIPVSTSSAAYVWCIPTFRTPRGIGTENAFFRVVFKFLVGSERYLGIY